VGECDILIEVLFNYSYPNLGDVLCILHWK